jgi:hypothetical protein
MADRCRNIVLGMGIAFLAAILLLPPDPSGRGAPGDGFLIIGFVGVGLLVSIIIFPAPGSKDLASFSGARDRNLSQYQTRSR